MHYGLYSLLGRGEWVQYVEQIPLAQYEKLAEDFTASGFDADFITDLALEAGMKYVNITTMHHDGSIDPQDVETLREVGKRLTSVR